MPKLTKKHIDSLKPDPDHEYVEWDSELKGFGLRVKPSGRKTYFVKYRNKAGVSRKIAIGVHGVITPDEARNEALKTLSDVAKGLDPAEDKRQERTIPTVAELCKRFLEEHASSRKAEKSAKQDNQYVNAFINPKLGKMKVHGVKRTDIAKLHGSMKGTPIQANRVLALLSKMFNLAEKWGYRPDGSNPCRHVEKYKESARERYLSNEELARLGEVLTTMANTEHPSAILCIRLLLATGCRLSEILTLKWDYIDLERRVINLPHSKTGKKTIALSEGCIQLLSNAVHERNNPYVCFGTIEGQHFINIYKPWARICKQAQIENCRIHDLRHTYASTAVTGGMSLPVLGKLLGHTQASTTQRYAHLSTDPMIIAANVIDEAIQAGLRGERKKKDNVVQIKPGETTPDDSANVEQAAGE